jgi:hypothetical protein
MLEVSWQFIEFSLPPRAPSKEQSQSAIHSPIIASDDDRFYANLMAAIVAVNLE